MPQDTKNKPYADNYPPLKAWLEKHEARCNWQAPIGRPSAPSAYVESWTIRGGGEVVIVVQANQTGWNIYTAARTNEIAGTLADAETRTGAAS